MQLRLGSVVTESLGESYHPFGLRDDIKSFTECSIRTRPDYVDTSTIQYVSHYVIAASPRQHELLLSTDIVVAAEIPRRKDSKFHILRQACEQESSFQDCETAKKGAFKRPLHTQHGPVNVVICQLKSESLMITVNDSALSEVPDQDRECLEHQVHTLYSKLVGNYCRAHSSHMSDL